LTGAAVTVAPRLLGAVVTSEIDGQPVAVRLTEVEGYEGPDDPASHAFRGRTPRTAVMFGPPGHLYCYFTYGMHWCANVVCGIDGVAAAVLLRAGTVVDGLDAVRVRRPSARNDVDLARGPARLARCLGLGRAHNGLDLLDPASPVRLAGVSDRPPARFVSGPRVGVSAAAERPLRFWVPDEPSVSVYRAGGRKRGAPRPAD
jgi:DNA-3-methyladenine glycosylase